MVGDMKAHLGDKGTFLGSACPLHGEAHCVLKGGTCSRGGMLWSTLDARDLHILNGCTNLAMHTCTTKQKGGATVSITVDYIIANSMALEMIDKVMIDNFLPCANSSNYHSHLMIMTCFGGSSQAGNLMDGGTCYHWVPGMESIWVEYTSMSDFVNC